MMTDLVANSPDLVRYELLQHLAGRIPDRALADARQMMSDGQSGPALGLVATAIARYGVPLTAQEMSVVRDLADDSAVPAGTRPVAAPPPLPFEFRPVDLFGEVRRDELDAAAAGAVRVHATGLAALWRSWRYLPLDGPPDLAAPAIDCGLAANPVYRVYIAQVEDPGLIGDVTGALTAAVAGEAGAEVIVLGTDPPQYQRAALDGSMLLWASVIAAEFEIAGAFDFADPDTGPGFAPDHCLIGDADRRERLLRYLRAGFPLLVSTSALTDVLDPAAGMMVPASFRTDGTWIWPDTVEYYLRCYGLAPDSRLTAHIEAQYERGETVPDVDEDTAAMAADYLLRPTTPTPPGSQASRRIIWPGQFGPGRPADTS